MRTEITNGQLMALEQDIKAESDRSPAFYFLNQPKLKRFYQQNGLLLRIINQKMGEFIKKYVKHDENEKPITEETENGQVFVFENEDVKKEYSAAVEEFMARTVGVEL